MIEMDVNDYVSYLSRYQVVICRACKYCITPNYSQSHFSDWHSELVLTTRQAITKYCNGLRLCMPNEMQIPMDKKPIDGLKVTCGRICLMDGCGYVCGKESMAEKHARTHGWVKGKDCTWRSHAVQVRRLIHILIIDIL